LIPTAAEYLMKVSTGRTGTANGRIRREDRTLSVAMGLLWGWPLVPRLLG